MENLLFTYNAKEKTYNVTNLENNILLATDLCDTDIEQILGTNIFKSFILQINQGYKKDWQKLEYTRKNLTPKDKYKEHIVKVWRRKYYFDETENYETEIFYKKIEPVEEITIKIQGKQVENQEEILDLLQEIWDLEYSETFFFKTRPLIQDTNI